jgi:N-acetylglucosamine kinase-like BadF-type ATPase
MTHPTVLGIDSGQTAIKVRIDDLTIEYPGVRTNTELLPQLADVVAATLARRPAGPVQVAIGTTGLTAAEDDPAALLDLVARHGVSRVLLAHDSITSFLGAIGFARGVVCAAGTGVVTLGVGREQVARVDGWGNIMGDAGSGYWVGREALDAVMRAHDGRGPQTLLTDVVRERFPVLEDAYIQLQTDPDRIRVVASFARPVADLAGQDVTAAAICARAGRELAHSVATAVHRIGETEDPLVCLIGGIFAGAAIRGACVGALTAEWPRLTLHPAEGDGLAGALMLPELPDHHPLADRVAIAG